MRRLLVVLIVIALVAGAVWYAVNFLQLREREPAVVGAWDSVPALGAACGRHCGTDRWAVKTLSDADRGAVNLRAVDATIEDLVLLPQPPHVPGRERLLPIEGTVYRVEGFLGGEHTEKDGDWHMVLFGRVNQRVSLIAEIPDPLCAGACRSGLALEYAKARAMLAERLARPNPRDLPIVVRVTGVGFFDREHGQAGAAPNGFELHPVLKIEFVE